jgi:outer membrane protein assembly factor BamB
VVKRVLILGALALMLGVALRLTTAPSPAIADPAPQAESQATPTLKDSRPRWETVWSRPAPSLAALALSPDGSSVAWVDKQGAVRRVEGATGRTIWRTTQLPGINRVCVGPQGAVLAYSRMNPALASVRILDPAVGAEKSALIPLDGAVWLAKLSADGQQAVVGTGSSSLYMIPVRRDAVLNGPSVRLPGLPESVAVASGEPIALLGTWQEGGVCAWGLDRSPRWRREEKQPSRTYDVQLSADGSTAVAVSSEGPRKEAARLHAWDARTGELLWIEDLRGFGPKVRISGNGKFIAVSYARVTDYSNGSTVERKVALFERSGRRRFEDRGGMYFSPEVVCLSATGDRLTVRDTNGTLWTLDRDGHTVARLRLPKSVASATPAAVREMVATEDGAYLLLYQADGQLSLLKSAQ